MPVTLVQKYNSEWTRWFKEICAHLGTEVSQACLRIEHVGSTSIPGMTAKPIIDLALIIRDDDFESVKVLLECRGYFHEGDLGIKDREAFGWTDGTPPPGIPYHHLYVCLERSHEWRRYVILRDYLRQHPADVERLSKLKWSLAEEFDNDREAYMALKSGLYEEINQKALGGKWPQERTAPPKR